MEVPAWGSGGCGEAGVVVDVQLALYVLCVHMYVCMPVLLHRMAYQAEGSRRYVM